MGGFIISLWSVFEACIKDLAEYVRRQKEIPFSLQDLRAGDFLEQTDKFFSRLLAVKAFPEKSVCIKLEELKGFRNALVHHDGATEDCPRLFAARQRWNIGARASSCIRMKPRDPNEDMSGL